MRQQRGTSEGNDFISDGESNRRADRKTGDEHGNGSEPRDNIRPNYRKEKDDGNIDKSSRGGIGEDDIEVLSSSKGNERQTASREDDVGDSRKRDRETTTKSKLKDTLLV